MGVSTAPPSVQSHNMHGKAAAAERQLFNPLLTTDLTDNTAATGNGQERHSQLDKALAQPHTISRFFAPAPSQRISQAASKGWGLIVSSQSGSSQPQRPAANGFQPLQAIKLSPSKMVRALQGALGHFRPAVVRIAAFLVVMLHIHCCHCGCLRTAAGRQKLPCACLCDAALPTTHRNCLQICLLLPWAV